MKRKQKRQDITASIQSFISYCHQRLHTHYRLILSSIRNSSNYRTEILPKSPSSSSYVGGRYPASPPTPIHHALPLRQQIGTRSTVMKSNQRRTLQVGLHPPNATTYRHGRSTCPVDTGEKAVDRTPRCAIYTVHYWRNPAGQLFIALDARRCFNSSGNWRPQNVLFLKLWLPWRVPLRAEWRSSLHQRYIYSATSK